LAAGASLIDDACDIQINVIEERKRIENVGFLFKCKEWKFEQHLPVFRADIIRPRVRQTRRPMAC